MSPTAPNAFQDLATGNFEAGLRSLSADPHWRDSSSTLDGLFDLRIPGAAGWGEGLLLASLLKRHAVQVQRPAEVLVVPQVLSILESDAAFRVGPLQSSGSDRPSNARSPLAILTAALTGTLLDRPFVPVAAGIPNSPSKSERPHIGLAWESVVNNQPIEEKSVPCDQLLTVLDGLDADVISFQRRLRPVDGDHIRTRFGARSAFISDTLLDGVDQMPVVKEIGSLDCMVTISTTTAHIAACLGVPVVLIAAQRPGKQWFWRAQADHGRCFYPSVRPVLGEVDGREPWWKNCLGPAREAVIAILGGKDRP